MADDFKYHIDHHARLIPPIELTEARAAVARGDASEAALLAAEDAAVTATLLAQRRLALLALSDGEYRRPHRLSVLYNGVDGFIEQPVAGGALGQLLGPDLLPERRTLVGAPAARGRLTKHETDSMLAGTQRSTMLTLPAPGFVAELATTEGETPSTGAELASLIRDEVAAVAADGVLYVLLTNPLYGFLLSASGRQRAAALGLDAAAVLRRMVAVDTEVLDGLETPENFRIGLDLTTGGAAIDESGYDHADLGWFVENQPFDRLCVEHPTAARFPLELLLGGTVVSLGLVDVANPTMESVHDVVARVDEAATILDIDDIAISTNGGFKPGVGLGEAEQRGKLQLVEMAARYFWGNEL